MIDVHIKSVDEAFELRMRVIPILGDDGSFRSVWSGCNPNTGDSFQGSELVDSTSAAEMIAPALEAYLNRTRARSDPKDDLQVLREDVRTVRDRWPDGIHEKLEKLKEGWNSAEASPVTLAHKPVGVEPIGIWLDMHSAGVDDIVEYVMEWAETTPHPKDAVTSLILNLKHARANRGDSSEGDPE